MGHGTGVTGKRTLYRNRCLQQGTDSKEEKEESMQGQGSPSDSAAKTLVDNHDHRIQLLHKSHWSRNDFIRVVEGNDSFLRVTIPECDFGALLADRYWHDWGPQSCNSSPKESNKIL